MKIIECPRDAMQGITEFIPTEKKIKYINALLKVGFDTIDFGSFVSPKMIPQMRDTMQVLEKLELDDTDSKLLAIVANERGALEATLYNEITYLGYPFSISETFQKRNTNATIENSKKILDQIYNVCLMRSKELVVYISMGFGNHYGDFWHPALVEHWVDYLTNTYKELNIISISDTVGIATPEVITDVFHGLPDLFPDIEFGAHLHTEPYNWKEKVEAAYKCGISRFDGAIKGFGGCPFAQNTLVGNMPTEHLISFFNEERADFYLNYEAFEEAKEVAMEVFMVHA